MVDTCTIYDFETLSTNPSDGVVLSAAMLNYDEARFISKPYIYLELIDKCFYMKFDVADQVKSYNRKISKDTLEWWSKQNKEAQEALNPSKDDVSIADLYAWFVVNRPANLERVYTRRNTFDPVFMSSVCKATGNPDPYNWWDVRDTISFIEGLSYGSGLANNFIPDGLAEHFVAHDPRHDIAIDVMRMQTVIQAVTAF
jgi:hypothetical protein